MKKTIPCPECRGRGFINYSTDNSMCATSCNNCNGTGSLEVTMTNFDRIKAMSVEEMADFLMDWFTDCMTGRVPMNVQKWLESEVDAG